MKKNFIHNADFLYNVLPDKCIKLIIADPPYFKIRGVFDFIWSTPDAYYKDVKNWAKECCRLLDDNGTLFWYGHPKNIAYTQVILDKYFNLINNLVWDKGFFMGLENGDGLRSFAPCTERILMYGSKKHDLTGLQAVEKEYIAPRNPFALELKKARIKKGVTINQIAEYGQFYGNVNHGGSVTNWEKGYNVPLKKQWKILCEYLPIKNTNYENLRNKYNQLRNEYNDLMEKHEEQRRTFNNFMNLTEVLRFSNEQAKTGFKYDHETVKPETLSRALILTCSKKKDLIMVPFAGSGTECAMAAMENREFIGFEINKKFADMGNKRCIKHLTQHNIFD